MGIAEPTASPPRPSSRRHLGRRAFAVSFVVILLLSVFGFLALRANDEQNRREAVGSVDRTAKLGGALGGALMSLATQELKVMSKAPAFQAGDAPAITAYFEAINPPSAFFFGGMAWLDAGRRTQARWDPPASAPVDFDTVPAVQAAATGTVSIEAGHRRAGQVLRPIVFAVPTFGPDNRTVNGVLTGAVTLDFTNPALLRQLFGTDDVLILDANRDVIFGSRTTSVELDTARAALDQIGAKQKDGVLRDVNGSVVGFARISGTDWVALVERSHDDLFGGSRWQYERSVAALALLVVASLAGAAYAAVRLDRVHQRETSSRQLFQTVLEQLPVGVAAVDRAGHVVVTNDRADEALGGRVDVGDPVPDALRVSLDAMARDQVVGGETVDRDGDEPRTLVVRAAPVEAAGQVTGAAVIVEDVTAQRRRARRAEMLAAASAGLAAASTPADVADIVAESTHAFGAVAAIVVLRDPSNPDQLKLRSAQGLDDRAIDGWEVIPVDASVPVAEAVRTGREVFITREDISRFHDMGPLLVQSENQAWAALPLRSAGRIAGALGLSFRTEDDLGVDVRSQVIGFAAQVSQALDRAGRQDMEHDVALVLQRGLLQPASGRGDSSGLEVVSRYAPAEDHLEVGGDFFDVLPLEDGSTMLVIGDVVGHGIDAASAMGQLRSATRALSATTCSPARLLELLDRFAEVVPPCRFATAAIVVVDPSRTSVRYSLAGHPPPVYAGPGGVTGFLDDALSRPLGISPGDRPEAVLELDAGPFTVCLYTDGLIEKRGEIIDAGLERLAERMARHAGETCDDLADLLLIEMAGGGRQRDDIALVCARISGRVS